MLGLENVPVIVVFAGRRLPRGGHRPIPSFLKQSSQTSGEDTFFTPVLQCLGFLMILTIQI